MGDAVLWYTPAKIEYDFAFPEDRTNCIDCRFCYKDSLDRKRCTITGEILLHAITERGHQCPAKIKYQ